MQPHTIVSREEWIAARKAHLAHEKEYTLAREKLSEERRALPWQAVARRSVRRPPPARGPAFHVRAGLERGLQELLVLG